MRDAGRNACRSSCKVCLFFSVVSENRYMSIDFSKFFAGLYFHGFTVVIVQIASCVLWHSVLSDFMKMGSAVELYYKESRRKGTSYIQWKEGRLTRLVTSCVLTASCNTLLKLTDGTDGKTRKKTSSYSMTLRKRESIGNWKRKH
jgi:hypothetical protein